MVRRRTPKIERYEFLEFLGAGRAGEVYLALDRETKALVAIKFYVLKNPDEEQLKKDVVRFLKGLQAHSELGEHPFVIGYRDSGYIPGAGIYLVTDLVDGCDFHSLVVEQGPLEWPVAKELFEEILEGLHFLHENQTAHRDIKPSNIMAEPKEGKWTAKIADFDLTHNFFKAGLDSYTSTKTAFYSEGFSPPEQIMQFQKLDPSADIYAIGMTFYFILMGNLPLAEMGDKPAFPELEAQFPVRSPIRDPLKKKNLPTAAIDALERCLRRNPADRFANAGELKKALFGG
jgi:serine/threonine-protein kinase